MLFECVNKEVEDMHRHLNIHLVESLDQVLTLNQSVLEVINLNEHCLKWLNMLQFNIKSSDALLNLEFLTLVKFTFTKVINDVLVLYITIKINCSWCRWHLNSVNVSLCMLIFTHEGMIPWVLSITGMDINHHSVFLIIVFSSYDVV